MAAIPLSQVKWSEAIESATKRHVEATVLAPLLSLSGLYASEYAVALSNARLACRIDPFNPLHQLRHVLLSARFGDLASASALLARLSEQEPDVPVIDYLRAVLALRGGRPEQARAIAASLETKHPTFLYAKFIRAEAQIVLAARASTAERFLAALPSGQKWDSLWCDLLVKLVLLHPQEGTAMAKKHLEKKVSADSIARAMVLKAIGWMAASAEDLGRHLANEAPNSRGEALVLECLMEKLNQATPQAAVRELVTLRRLHPERNALRRVHHAFLTRRAGELVADKHYEEALRLMEQCMREQPNDAIYYQNCAALFSLLREPEAYHDAWAALNAHQYRLVLLGALDPLTMGQIVKTHRLFAQQARGSTSTSDRLARGIFRWVESESGDKPRVVTNTDEINADPELLRQWIYHTAAELVLRHAAIGDNARRLLLQPEDRDDAFVRAAGLSVLLESLAVLVPEEGSALAKLLSARWNDAATTICTRYPGVQPSPSVAEARTDEGKQDDAAQATVEEPQDDQVSQLQEEHVATMADLCLLCLQWRPPYGQIWIAEELLKFVDAELAFLDQAVVRRAEKREGYETPYAIRVLSDQIGTAGDPEKAPGSPAERRRAAVGRFKAELLREMANSTYDGHRGSAKESAARAMVYLDRARALDSTSEDIELTAARLLSLGEYFDEARMALQRFRRLVKPDNRNAIEQADKIDDLLRERRKEGTRGHRRQLDVELLDSAAAGSDARIGELLRELDASPAAWQIYDELVKELGALGRFDEAIQWADRSVAQCLNRTEQINARGLAMEARGLKVLAETNPRAARLFAVGVHDPARKAIEGLAQDRELDYVLSYLLGRCQLAGGLPDEARASFETAAKSCDRQIYRTILRHLTTDIDQAYLTVARSSVDAALRDGDLDGALAQAVGVFSRVRQPATWLLDLGRIFYSAALSGIGGERAPLVIPRFHVEANWQQELADALAQPSDVERALRIAELGARLLPASARPAQLLSERARTLQKQMAAVAALNEVGRLLADRRFDQVLAKLNTLDPAIAAEPRLIRIQVLALLGLNRFEDADAAVVRIGEGGTSEVRDFIGHYPTLLFHRRVAVAQQLLKDAKSQEAAAVLNDARPTGAREQAELDYCRAFAAALQGYALRRERRQPEARSRFNAAMALLEPHLAQAGADGRHIVELFDRLEKEADVDVRG